LYIADLVPFAKAWQWQRQLVCDRKQTPILPDILLLMQHPPVYTLGQGASESFLKFPAQASTSHNSPELYRIERGGEVTYHCPGQLVGYPILNLQRHQTDLHWYLRQLEEVLIQVLAHYGLKAERLAGFTGVWVNGHKVAAIGIKASRWITMHGFALNIRADLSGFGDIVPCGIADKPVGSLHQFLPDIAFEQVQAQVIETFSDVFQLHFQALPPNWEP
jgi:lipoyl(octanoyl) transferase